MPWVEFVNTYRGRLNTKRWEDITKISIKVDGKRLKVGSIAKRNLHHYLWREQKGLCAYCMQSIPERGMRGKSHLEHIRPKSKFGELRFDCFNIVVSCNGLNCSSDESYDGRVHCGMYKDNRKGSGITFDEKLFVNPTEMPIVEECFSYTVNGQISYNSIGAVLGRARVDYMIKYLGLDVGYLDDFRKREYDSLIDIEAEEGVEFVEALISDQASIAVSFQPMMKQLFELY